VHVKAITKQIFCVQLKKTVPAVSNSNLKDNCDCLRLTIAFDTTQIGLMRCGKLLAESSPQQLLEQFQCSTLEEAFLTLSQTQSNTDISTMRTFKRETESVSYQNDYYYQAQVNGVNSSIRFEK